MLSENCKVKLKIVCSSLSKVYLENQESIPENNEDVSFLGSGWFSKAYSLAQFPHLVVKFCAQKVDAFPVYIRYLDRMNYRPRWSPEVLLWEGSELNGVFWCVMPKYETIRSGKRYGEKSEVLPQFKDRWEEFEKKLLSIRSGQVNSSDSEVKEMQEVFLDFCKLSETLDDKGNPYLDTHAGNILWNNDTQSFIYLDPIRYVKVETKKKYNI